MRPPVVSVPWRGVGCFTKKVINKYGWDTVSVPLRGVDCFVRDMVWTFLSMNSRPLTELFSC